MSRRILLFVLIGLLSLVVGFATFTPAQAVNVVRQIVLAGFMFANDHGGEWPQKLDELVPKYAKQDLLQQETFIYFRPKKEAKTPQNIVVLHQKLDKGAQIAVGFLDGHAELVAADQFPAKFDQATGIYRR